MTAPFDGVSAGTRQQARGALGRRVVWCSAVLVTLALGCSSDTKSNTGTGGSSGAPMTAGGSGMTGSAGATAGGTSGGAGTGGSSAGDGNDSGNGGAAMGGSSGASESAGAGGTAGGTSTPMWTMSAGRYQLSLGNTFLEIDPANGARITALRVGGATAKNLLADATVTGQADNWGSTFWPSPQTWPWPPTDAGSINAINTLPYAAVLDSAANTLTLTSSVNAAVPKIQLVKKFSADAAKEAIQIDYTVTNGGSAAVTTAPWEVTRVPPGGITFYPLSGEPFYHGTPPIPMLVTEDIAGVTWYQHDPTVTDLMKAFADGKDGWMAHADGDLLLIKTFPDITQAQAATNEAEIEIYAAPMYEEMETQGAVQTLAMGESLHWTVRWYARKLSAPAAIGSAELVAYVQNQIK